MPDNVLQLSIQVDNAQANRAIKLTNVNFDQLGASGVKAGVLASHGMNSIERGVLKGAAAGTLLASALQHVAGAARDWLGQSVLLAAQLERLRIGTESLARARGVDAAAVNRWIQQVKDIDFTTRQATEFVNRMLTAGQDLAKAPILARYAENLAIAFGGTSEEVLDKLFIAIETGQARALRRMGINVDLAKVTELATLKAKLQGRTLTENEEVAVRFDAVMQKLAATTGIGARANEKAAERQEQLTRDIEETKTALGQRLLPAWNSVLSALLAGTRHILDHADAWGKLATVLGATAAAMVAVKGAGFLAGALKGAGAGAAGTVVGAAAAPLLYGPRGEVLRTTAAAAAGAGLGRGLLGTITGPLTLSLASVASITILGGSIVLAAKSLVSSLLKDRAGRTPEERLAEETQQARNEAAARALAHGDRGAALALLGKGPLPPTGADEAGLAAKIKAAQLGLEIQKKQNEAARSAREFLLSTQDTKDLGPLKAMLEVAKEIEKLTTLVDDRGVLHRFALSQAARLDMAKALQEKLRRLHEETHDERIKEIYAELRVTQELTAERIQQETELFARRRDMAVQLISFEQERAGFTRDAQLRQLDLADAQTLAQKLSVEQQKADIEVQYIERVHQIKMRLFDLETVRILAEERVRIATLNTQLEGLNLATIDIEKRLAALAELRGQVRATSAEETAAAVKGAKESAVVRQVQLVRDQTRQLFDSIKQQAGGVFDALLTKSSSVFAAIGNVFKTAILTAIKDVVTSRIAALFTQLLTGQRVGFAQAGVGGGVLGRLGGILGMGAVPVFGSGGVAGLPGTPSFSGAPIAGLAGTGTGGLLSRAGLSGNLQGIKDFFGIGGSIQLGPGRATTWEAGTLGQKLGALGKSDAALLGGIALAAMGLKRGGLSGLAMTSAGGAMVGFKFGGPLGAAIGAAAGAVAGIIRLFVKGAREKAREKIKALYGVEVSDHGILDQIVQMAKQSFGGNLDVAIHSPQIRDLIELYAMTTGQKAGGIPAKMSSLSLIQSGGSLFQSPTYVNGSALGGLDRIGAGLAQNAGAGTQVIHVVVPGAQEFFRRETLEIVLKNGRLVQAAAIDGAKGNAGRREMAALQLSPGTLTS